MPAISSRDLVVRRAIRIEGVVHGVAFRASLARLARSLGLAGAMKDDAGAVAVEVEGAPSAVARFVDEISRHAPPNVHVDSIEHIEVTPVGANTFEDGGRRDHDDAKRAELGAADAGPCEDCLHDVEEHAYPFVSCGACGPRYAILDAPPFSRAHSSLNALPMCEACARASIDPSDRRCGAETLSCPRCGPTLAFLPSEARGPDALADAVRALSQGLIVAVKGAGGYVLCCDAGKDDAVRRLRQRKRRPDKPFAVMVRDAARADELVVVEGAARRALTSPARPIVIAPAHATPAMNGIARSVAPGLRDLGVCLPPTPLFHLLVGEALLDLAVTSGNPQSEPSAFVDDDALKRLAGIADAFLFFDRDIRRRVDDSIVRAATPAAAHGDPHGKTSSTPLLLLRRARGYAPDPFALPIWRDGAPPIVAVGGDDDAAVCVAVDGRAIVSPRIADLGGSNAASLSALGDTLEDLARLAGASVANAVVVHDLDPDLRASRHALPIPSARRIAVAHQHAHAAACLVDNGRTDRVLALCFDGPALGADGLLGGGDLLDADLWSARSLGGLRPLSLCGGANAMRTPWRLAVAALADAEVDGGAVLARIDPDQRAQVEALLPKAPLATSASSYIAAAASLCGLCDKETFPGQAALLFDDAACLAGPVAPYPLGVDDGPFTVDLRPAVRALAADTAPEPIRAARFTETLAAAALLLCRAARHAVGAETAALTGSAFEKRRLLERTRLVLEGDGFEVLRHRRIPANDGCLSLGQAAVAAAQAR